MHGSDGFTNRSASDLFERSQESGRQFERSRSGRRSSPCRSAPRTAPATRNSITSSIVAIPPTAMTGNAFAFAICQTIRSTSGLIAGPLRPPVTLPRIGLLLPPVDAMPRSVFTSDTASAPPSAAALAIATMSVTFGVSLAMSGMRAGVAAAADDAPRDVGVGGEVDPAGDVRARQVQFQPGQPTAAGRSSSAISTNSSSVLPAMLPMTAVGRDAEVRQVVVEEVVDAVVIEADGVEHAGWGLDRPRRRVADSRLGGDGLRDDAAEAGEVDEAGHFPGVAEGARGDEDRVAQ